MQELLYGFGPSVDDASDADRARWKAMLSDTLEGNRYSAISVSSEKAWLKAIKRALCMYDRQDAVIICQSTSEQQRLNLIVHRLRGQEFQNSNKPITESPVFLIDQLSGHEFQEVFLSAEFGPDTPRGILHQVFSSARVGLHLVRSFRH
jgi:hypothetical protein